MRSSYYTISYVAATTGNYPSFLLSNIPSDVLLILLNVFQISVDLTLAKSVTVVGTLFYKYLNRLVKTFIIRAKNVASPIFNTSAVVEFESVVSASRICKTRYLGILHFYSAKELMKSVS